MGMVDTCDVADAVVAAATTSVHDGWSWRCSKSPSSWAERHHKSPST